MRALLAISNGIDAVLEVIAKVFGWCFVLMAIVIALTCCAVIDASARTAMLRSRGRCSLVSFSFSIAVVNTRSIDM